MKTIAPITETDILDVAGPPRKTKATDPARAVTADLVAVLGAVTDCEPRIMTIANGGALPSGPFEFKNHSLQTGLRAWVETQTPLAATALGGLGQSTDRPPARLCRTTLYFCRSWPHRRRRVAAQYLD